MGMMLRRRKAFKPAEKPVEDTPKPVAEEVKKRGSNKQAKT